MSGLRKAAGITQTALTAEIGISQRMMAYYEGPNAQPPANLLPTIGRALGVSIDALLGVEVAKRKVKATDTRLQRRLQQIERLPPQERRQILQLLDAFIERGQLKQKSQAGAAGLLNSQAIEGLLRERLRKKAGEELRAMMDTRAAANIPPMSMEEIQAEVNAVRKAHKAGRRS